MAIGLRECVPLTTLENVVLSVIDGSCTQEYIDELIALETSGKSRADNLNRTIRRMAVNSPLMPFVIEHEQEFKSCIRSNINRSVVYTALVCASYPLFYDLISTLGKYFHVQDEVSTSLIRAKLSQKYGNGENSSRGYTCAVRMLVNTGLLNRVQTGVFQANRFENLSDFAQLLYKKAFLLYNPTYTEADDVETNPFFEFIR